MRLDRAMKVVMDSTNKGHVSPSFSDFLTASSFFYSNNSYRSMLATNWRLCTQLNASACKICFRVAMSFIVPAHFPNQISKGRKLNSWNPASRIICAIQYKQMLGAE
jgi:hypothetical protein